MCGFTVIHPCKGAAFQATLMSFFCLPRRPARCSSAFLGSVQLGTLHTPGSKRTHDHVQGESGLPLSLPKFHLITQVVTHFSGDDSSKATGILRTCFASGSYFVPFEFTLHVFLGFVLLLFILGSKKND